MEKELIEYIKGRIEYCKMAQKAYPVERYLKNGKLTDEQMTGYYQGMGAWLYAILSKIEDINKSH